MSIFFIADTHFGDERILRYENRPFESANWVKVEHVNDDKSVEGNVIKNWLPAEETAAWVFGAYLE